MSDHPQGPDWWLASDHRRWLATRDSAIWQFRPSGAVGWILLPIFFPIASVIFLTLPEGGRRVTVALIGGLGLGFAIAVATGWTLV